MKRTKGRIDHFIWVVRPENVEAYIAQLSELFDTTFDHKDGPSLGPWPTGRGIHAYVAWDAGLEVIAPVHADDPLAAMFSQHLHEHGEGPFGFVFGVDDLVASIERANTLGYPVQPPLPKGRDDDDEADRAQLAAWTDRVVEVREAIVGDVLGTRILFGEIDYREDQ